MRLGAHLSIAKGLPRALESAVERACQCLQVFVGNPRAWQSSPLPDAVIEAFRTRRAALGRKASTRIEPVVAHMPYLPNLASRNPDFYRKSRTVLAEQLQRCAQLGIEYLVVHMGKHEGAGLPEAVERMARAIGGVLEGYEGSTVLLLENTAGQGSETGRTMQELGLLLGALAAGGLVGVCLDTCHLFAAGYDLTRRGPLEGLVDEIEAHIGLEKVRLLHLNDSRKPCGSRVDRHANIGQGEIGQGGFRRVLHHPAFRALPGIIETPQKEFDDVERDLACLRRCLR